MKPTDGEEIVEINETWEENKSDETIEQEIKVAPVKYVRPPAFQRAWNFWKSSFQNNTSNNRQRPGRAAWRGR